MARNRYYFHLAAVLVATGCAEGFTPTDPGPAAGGSTSNGGGEEGGHTVAEGGSGAQGGAGGVCDPGAEEACYGGPDGTEGVGECTGGARTCMADGTWSDCDGEVLPTAEECQSAGDEDCDGSACSDVLWSLSAGDGGDDAITDLAFDAQGNLYVAGTFDGTIDLGGGPLTSAGGADVFVAKLDGNGGHLWSKRFGDASDAFPPRIAVDANGAVYVAGAFTGTVSFGGAALVSCADGLFESDAYLAKLDGAGNHVYSRALTYHGGGNGTVPGEGIKTVQDVAVAGSVVVVVGWFTGHFGGICFNGCPQSANGQAGFVRTYNAASGVDVYQSFLDVDGASSQSVDAVAGDGAGNIAFAGTYQATIDLGGGVVLTKTGQTASEGFVALMSPSGDTVWGAKLGSSTGSQYPSAVAFDGAGAVHVGGWFFGDMAVGPTDVDAAAEDVFELTYSASGAFVAGSTHGDGGDEHLVALATSPRDEIVVAGSFEAAFDLGGPTLSPGGAADTFLGKLGATSQHLWSKSFGQSGTTTPAAVAVDGGGRIALGGKLTGTADFGDGVHGPAPNGDDDAFIAVFQP